jgi:hypothetical protein
MDLRETRNSGLREGARQRLANSMHLAERDMAPMLFDVLSYHGQVTFRMERWSRQDPKPPWMAEIGIHVSVNPAMYVQPEIITPVMVSAHTFHLQDWQCPYCGCWNSGTKTPYKCPNCDGPRKRMG